MNANAFNQISSVGNSGRIMRKENYRGITQVNIDKKIKLVFAEQILKT